MCQPPYCFAGEWYHGSWFKQTQRETEMIMLATSLIWLENGSLEN